MSSEQPSAATLAPGDRLRHEDLGAEPAHDPTRGPADPMRDHLAADSVGLVVPHSARFEQALELDCGRRLDGFELVYESYGELNAARSNAVLICHALSGDHHAAGYHDGDDPKPGWWDACIGPGKAIDTRRFFVVCPNNLGSCRGSTGPLSIDPDSAEPYGPGFPIVTVRDWVRAQAALAQRLGIAQWAAVVGGSLGGMNAMQWAIDLPERVRHCVMIAVAPRLSAQNIAFNEVARQAIRSDPDFHEGHYFRHGLVPRRGLMLARMLGHITYLSEDSMRQKFGRELREGRLTFDFDINFQVESYLRHQGTAFVDRFDANSYLLMTKLLDYFDPAAEFGGDLVAALRRVQARSLVLSFSTDWRFTTARSLEVVHAMMKAGGDVSFAEIDAEFGHDSFLMPVPDYLRVFGAYMLGIPT
jgi:homoserine O-acetyltransferase